MVHGDGASSIVTEEPGAILEIYMNKFVRFMNDESGATAIEYGLIAAAMGLMLVAVMPILAGAISTVFQSLATGMAP